MHPLGIKLQGVLNFVNFKGYIFLFLQLNQRLQGPMEPDVLKSAKSADRKLIFVPLLLFFGRFFGILKFFLVMFSDQKRVPMLKWTEKALLTLEVSIMGDQSLFI